LCGNLLYLRECKLPTIFLNHLFHFQPTIESMNFIYN